jgi:hypothetical protein
MGKQIIEQVEIKNVQQGTANTAVGEYFAKHKRLAMLVGATQGSGPGALVATESWKTRFPGSTSCPEALVAIDSWKNRFSGAPTMTTTTSEALVAADSWENLLSARAPGPPQSRRISFDHVGELPSPSPSALEKWMFRSKEWQDSVSVKYGQTLRRFLGLAETSDAYERILELQRLKPWKETTTASYWQAVLTARRLLNIAPTAEEKRATKLLESAARACRIDYPQPMTTDDLFLFMRIADMPSRVAVVLAFLWGQRISDILQLKKEDFSWELFGQQKSFLTCTLRRGKVIPLIGPYSLFMPDSQLSREVFRFVTAAKDGFLFTGNNTLNEREEAGRRIRDLLKLVDPNLEQRSIRRGGLEKMARAGVPLTQIRMLFSKHVSDHMLMRYLANGRALFDAAATSAIVTGWAEQLCLDDRSQVRSH